MRYERPAVHRTIFVADVEGYGDRSRTTPNRLALREGLYSALRRAFDDAGIRWADCRTEDCGDGVFVLAPAKIPKGPFVEFLPSSLAAALQRHNQTHQPEAQIRLRVALHAGEVIYDDHGVTAPAINHAFRLLEAQSLKEALKTSQGALALITSAWFFDEVVRHSDGLDPTTFRPVPVAVKETRTTGWIALPDRPYPAEPSKLAESLASASTAKAQEYRQWRRFRRQAKARAQTEAEYADILAGRLSGDVEPSPGSVEASSGSVVPSSGSSSISPVGEPNRPERDGAAGLADGRVLAVCRRLQAIRGRFPQRRPAGISA